MTAENYIRKAFKSLTVHLTIGGVLKRPPLIRGHVCLTIDGEYIIDLTLGTWLANTKPFTHYGSIVSGMAGALSFQDFSDATQEY